MDKITFLQLLVVILVAAISAKTVGLLFGIAVLSTAVHWLSKKPVIERGKKEN